MFIDSFLISEIMMYNIHPNAEILKPFLDIITLKYPLFAIHIFNSIILQLHADLTTGCSDNNLNPFNKQEISIFVQQNYKQIRNIIILIIDDAEADDTIPKIIDYDFETIREYMTDIQLPWY
jgi:hypothetical protein